MAQRTAHRPCSSQAGGFTLEVLLDTCCNLGLSFCLRSRRWHMFRTVRTPASYRQPPPSLGEHTETVLADAGFSAAEITQLRHKGTPA